MQQINQAGLELIKSFEGYRNAAYLCPANIWTIGWGTTKGVRPGQTTNPEEAENFLKRDLKVFEAQVSELVKIDLTSNQFSALVCFTYNCGAGALKSSTLLKKLNQEDCLGAAEEFLKWNKAGGKTLAGLTRRRVAERSLFLRP